LKVQGTQQTHVKLCESCEYYVKVESADVGVVAEACSILEMNLVGRGQIKSCTRYQSKNLPHLMAREAWTIHKNNEGKIEFMNQMEYRYYSTDAEGKIISRKPNDGDDD
jgi:hypothetical protein